MDAIITAGGIPLPEEPLYAATLGHPKAMVDIAGKPMIQWVLDALTEAKTVEHVIIVGLTEKSGLTCGKEITYIPNQGKMVENLQAGARKALEITPKARQVLMISSDIPAITGEMVDWVANNAMQTDDDVYYHVIRRAVMEKRFPGSRRTWTRLKDMEVCGADMNVARLKFLASGERSIWDKILDARKSPLRQAALIGYDTALLLVIGQLELEQAVTTVSKRLKLSGRAVVCPYAEIGMDVDKPHQLEIMRADLKKHMLTAERKATGPKTTPKKPPKASPKKPPKTSPRKPPKTSPRKPPKTSPRKPLKSKKPAARPVAKKTARK